MRLLYSESVAMHPPNLRHLAVALLVLAVTACSSSLKPDGHPDDTGVHASNSSDSGEGDLQCRELEGSFVLPARAPDFADAVGDAKCASVRGNLVIRGELGSIEVLESLERLDVGGDVSVETLGGLRNLEPLRPLRNVGGDLNVESNQSLVSTAGLANLRSVGDDLRIAKNPKLRRVRGPQSLQQIGSDLRITDNPALRKVVGFDGLAAIAEYDGADDRPDPAGSTFGDDPENRGDGEAVDPHLVVTDNPNLEVVRGFPNLTDVDGDLRFIDNRALETVRGFGRLEFVTGELVVENQPNLSDISALVRTSCLRQIHLENTGLTDLSALANLWEIGRLRILDNPNLQRLGDWRENLRLRGPVHIRDNSTLIRLQGFRGVTAIQRDDDIGDELPDQYAETANAECVPLESGDDTPSGSLEIANNDRLESLDGLQLRTVGSSLVLRDNDRLDDLTGFSELNDLGGDLQIEDNDALSRLQSFGELTEIEGDLLVADNHQLKHLRGFDRLNRIDGEFRIRNNRSLQTVTGFYELDSTGRLVIRNNSVTDLDGLAQISSVDGLTFENNDAIDALQDFPALENVFGAIRIQQNDQLAALRNFDQLERVHGGFVVQENPALPNCDARTVAESPRSDYVLVEDNAPCP